MITADIICSRKARMISAFFVIAGLFCSLSTAFSQGDGLQAILSDDPPRQPPAGYNRMTILRIYSIIISGIFTGLCLNPGLLRHVPEEGKERKIYIYDSPDCK